MLLLSRKIEEKILINNNIEITVLEIHENTVKLGINAPKSIPILRSELCETVEQNKKAMEKTDKSIINQIAKNIHIKKGEK